MSRWGVILDQLLYLESINEELSALRSKIGAEVSLPRKNVTDKNREVGMSDEDIAYLESVYKKDFEALEYDTLSANPDEGK